MSTPTGEKVMSSRLLTMKFMQRAGGSPHTPSSSPGGPPSKRMRLSNGTASPVTPTSALQDALDAEEVQRLQALEKHAEAMGETRWVLSVQEKPQPANGTLNVVTASFGDIDALSDDDLAQGSTVGDPGTARSEDAPSSGRRVFGKMKKRRSAGQTQDDSDSSESSSSDPDEDDNDNDPAAQLIREERREAAAQAREKRRAKRKADQAESHRLAEERRKKEVKLNKLTSISGSGGSRSAGSTPTKDFLCYKCGKQGHTKAKCPNR